jgi:hypothetical protein
MRGWRRDVTDAVDATALRARILELFERHRQAPGTPFDEAHFLDFLLAAPKRRRAVYDSFAGLRRYNAFLDDVQLELAVCYSFKDWDGNYPLDRFVARTAELIASPKSSRASLRNQRQRGFGGQGVLLVGNVPLLMLAAATHRHPVAFAVAIALVVALNGAFAWLAWRYWRTQAALRRRLGCG